MSPDQARQRHTGEESSPALVTRTASTVRVISAPASPPGWAPTNRTRLVFTILLAMSSNGYMTASIATTMMPPMTVQYGKAVTAMFEWCVVVPTAAQPIRCALKTGKNSRAAKASIMLVSGLLAISDCIAPATIYVIFRASTKRQIKAPLAANGCSIGKSCNAGLALC